MGRLPANKHALSLQNAATPLLNNKATLNIKGIATLYTNMSCDNILLHLAQHCFQHWLLNTGYIHTHATHEHSDISLAHKPHARTHADWKRQNMQRDKRESKWNREKDRQIAQEVSDWISNVEREEG